MKKTLVSIGIAALLMLTGGRAEALSLTPTGTTCTTTQNLSLGAIYDLLAGCFGVSVPKEDFDLLYKAEGGGGEEGVMASSYNTSISESAATIQYGAGSYCLECYLLVKGGNTRYFFDISGWNGTETISLSGWGGRTYGGISNVAIYGVPEPATALLLAMGLGVLAVRKRRQKA
jgi:PEP-CTERM motif